MADADRWDGGDRLRQAIEYWKGGPEGIEAFVRALQDHAKAKGAKIPGANRAMVQRYLGNKAAPSIDFLHEAAGVLGVRFPWLAVDEGPPTETQTKPPPGMFTEEEFWALEEQFIASLDLGRDDRQYSRRAALLRFDRTLSDAQTPDSPWTKGKEAREAMLRAAGRFLVAVDAGVEEAGKRDDPERPFWDELLLRESRSYPWSVMWYDQALALFAQRVRGLGVRTGGWYDAHDRHHATARNPAPY